MNAVDARSFAPSRASSGLCNACTGEAEIPISRGRNMQQEEYKGRTITVDTHRIGKGWVWSYQIDGGPIRKSGDRPLDSEELVRKEAIGEAKAEVDRMT